MDNIRNPSAPNLILAPVVYNKQYMDQLTNQLRLYFTQVDSAQRNLIQSAQSESVLSWLSEGSF